LVDIPEEKQSLLEMFLLFFAHSQDRISGLDTIEYHTGHKDFET